MDDRGKCYESLKGGNFPLVMGGDHSIAIGSIAGISQFYREQNKRIGIIWVDAHADINTPESSPSGNIHGMPLATLLGFGHKSLTSIGGEEPKVLAKNVALIGIRTIDDHEKEELKRSGVNYFSMRDIDEKGMFQVMKEAIAAVSDGTDGIHVFSISMVLILAMLLGFPLQRRGLTFREAHLALEMAHETKRMSSLEFVELNPTDVGAQSANLTVAIYPPSVSRSFNRKLVNV